MCNAIWESVQVGERGMCQDKLGHVCAPQALTVDALVSMCVSYLLRIIGHVWKHGGHVKHDLVVLIGGIQGVCSS